MLTFHSRKLNILLTFRDPFLLLLTVYLRFSGDYRVYITVTILLCRGQDRIPCTEKDLDIYTQGFVCLYVSPYLTKEYKIQILFHYSLKYKTGSKDPKIETLILSIKNKEGDSEFPCPLTHISSRSYQKDLIWKSFQNKFT